VELALLQPGQSPAPLLVRWIGQDKHDFVGPHNRLEPSDVQDIHIELGGLDPRREVVFVDVTGHGGDEWQFSDKSPHWKAELRRDKGARAAHLFLEPNRVETGRSFHILLRYNDGSTAEAYLSGRRADPNLRMPGAALLARWIGQDRVDLTAGGPSVGPDGIQDVHVSLTRLGSKAQVKAVRVEGPSGTRWEVGINPKVASNAELLRDEKDRSKGELYFQPDRDLSGQRLKLTVEFDNDKRDTATLVAGRCDPKLRMPAVPLPKLAERSITAEWLGQDGQGARPGDVHVVVSGLPAASPIVAAVLSDSLRGMWAYRAGDRTPLPPDPPGAPLALSLRTRRTSADLFFAPYRNESGTTFSLAVFSADGRIALARFPGGDCDLSRRAQAPAGTRVDAKPGDDIQSLVDRYGTVVLSRGTYRLVHALILSHPVILTSEGGATLLFAQDGGDPPWTAAIKVHCGNTTLNGFAVRFAGPVRWNNATCWGPAVIGMTDNFDQQRDEPIANVAFTRLDLEVPPVEKRDEWVEALRLMRLNPSGSSGVIAGNVLRGGPVEFLDGPWRIAENEFRGALPGTYSHGVFEGHYPHDLQIRGNKTHSPNPSGKTWRFLVLTGSSFGDAIERNVIEGIGARDDDTIPWSNEPEVILTEAYMMRYEGRVMALSRDGSLLQIGRPQGEPPRTGDVVSLLNGPAAGQWRRIVLGVGAGTYLVDPPIPAGTEVVSIVPGFVSQAYEQNRIDIRGGRRSFGLVLTGSAFGTRLVKNHFLGGANAFRVSAYPTEKPVFWGWSHCPYLGGVVEGNVIEDTEGGAYLGVDHDHKYIKSNQGRTYMTVRLNDNVVRWSESFLSRVEHASSKEPLLGVTLGQPGSDDPGEFVVTAQGNRLESPAGHRLKPALLINAARYNGERLQNRRLDLGSSGGTAARREFKSQQTSATR
jgi:hypothetical protein